MDTPEPIYFPTPANAQPLESPRLTIRHELGATVRAKTRTHTIAMKLPQPPPPIDEPLYLLTIYQYEAVIHLGIFRSLDEARQAWTTLQKQGGMFGGVDLRGVFPEIEVFRLDVLGGRVI